MVGVKIKIEKSKTRPKLPGGKFFPRISISASPAFFPPPPDRKFSNRFFRGEKQPEAFLSRVNIYNSSPKAAFPDPPCLFHHFYRQFFTRDGCFRRFSPPNRHNRSAAAFLHRHAYNLIIHTCSDSAQIRFWLPESAAADAASGNGNGTR